MKTKKGISPLIAWVLLIGLSVSIGFMVMRWAVDVIPEPEPDLSFCEDVSLFLINQAMDDSEINLVNFNITNNGLFKIDKWSFGIVYSVGVTYGHWCEEPDLDLLPGENKVISFYLGQPLQGGSPLCSDIIPFVTPISSSDLVEVSLVPWIGPIEDEEKINCNDKKINIKLET